jgi:hypothetical protein
MVEFVFKDEFVIYNAKIGGVCLKKEQKLKYPPFFWGVLLKN